VQQPADTGAVELLDVLPAGAVALEAVSEPTLRRLFAAFQLQVRYDKHANWATLQVTLHEDRLDELLAVAGAITDPQGPPAHGDGTTGGPHLPMRCRCRGTPLWANRVATTPWVGLS
jgi:hypothetical protein